MPGGGPKRKRAADNKSARNVEYEMWPDDAPKSETAKGAAAGADSMDAVDEEDGAFECTRVHWRGEQEISKHR